MIRSRLETSVAAIDLKGLSRLLVGEVYPSGANRAATSPSPWPSKYVCRAFRNSSIRLLSPIRSRALSNCVTSSVRFPNP